MSTLATAGTPVPTLKETVPALVELQGVTRTYVPDGAPVLAGIDLRVPSGGYTAIVGESGSGKSTLLNVLGLLDRPTSGNYLFDGAPTGVLPERTRSALRAGAIGFVFQSFHLLPQRTVLDNVLLATLYSGVPRRERRDRALQALEQVRMLHRTEYLPTHLSGGERQRVAVARAVVARPRLLLADEPTGNLDRSNTDGVLELFGSLHAGGLTLVVITHDLHVASHASRRVGIVDGRLEEHP